MNSKTRLATFFVLLMLLVLTGVLGPYLIGVLANPNLSAATAVAATDPVTYLPYVIKPSQSPGITPTPIPSSLIQPADLLYLGAFRLPGDSNPPQTFDYGGAAMTFNPNGDPAGPTDGFPGSLFIMGHERQPYGALPNGNQIAEVNIPAPVIAASVSELNTASFLQGFSDVAEGFFTAFDYIPRTGMLYLDHPATGPKIHLTWGQHFQDEPPYDGPSHGWFDPTLSTPNMQGEWYIGDQSPYSVNSYLFEIPATWADTYASGRYLATGRFRDGGWSGMGPALFAYRPWQDGGAAPATGTHLAETPLLLYASSFDTDIIEQCLDDYQHPDQWEGGAWLTTTSGKTAVLFAGSKSNGVKYWYGWINPASPDLPCVDAELVGEAIVCRLADGSPCPPADLTECEGHTSERGWWSTHFDGWFILYDPADLARVATNELEPWQPQPYAFLDVDDHLFLNPDGVEIGVTGSGIQQRYRFSDMAYDRTTGLLYILELYADGARPVVHIWQVAP